MPDRTQFVYKVAKTLEETGESLRWCRQHLGERGVIERLNELNITLGALSLALDYEMDGRDEKTALALEQANWKGRPRPFPGRIEWYHH
jgi:hypothetical protein